MVEQIHEVKPHSHSQLDVVNIRPESNLLLVDDIAAAPAQLQLVGILNTPPSTLLLSRSTSLPCSESRSKLPRWLARRCASASSSVGYARMSTRI